MKPGDRVRNKYKGLTGTILRIGDWDYNFNPYKVMVVTDYKEPPNNVSNFKESHLEAIIQGGE